MEEVKQEIDEKLKAALFGVVYKADATITEDYAGMTIAIPKINAIIRFDKIRKETVLMPLNIIVGEKKDDKPQ